MYKIETFPTPCLKAWSYPSLLEGLAEAHKQGYTIDTTHQGNMQVAAERRVYLLKASQEVSPAVLEVEADVQTVPKFDVLRGLEDTLENKKEISKISEVFGCGMINLQKYKTVVSVVDEFERRYKAKPNS